MTTWLMYKEELHPSKNNKLTEHLERRYDTDMLQTIPYM